jgi:hypothetical protein
LANLVFCQLLKRYAKSEHLQEFGEFYLAILCFANF